MTIVVISPPEDRPGEAATAQALLAAGIDRYHLRKPGWSLRQVEAWLAEVPPRWHERVVLHSHHALADDFRVWGVHFRDGEEGDVAPNCRLSRSCHGVAAVRTALGGCDSLFFGPIFPSLSKPGYRPVPARVLDELQVVLAARPTGKRTTEVLALGGLTPHGLERSMALGFDGVAVLGAIWNAADPVAAFLEFQSASRQQSAGRAAARTSTTEQLQ